MNFRELIKQNEASDKKQTDRISSQSNQLMDDFAAFVRSIDKDMIAAISKFGHGDYTNRRVNPAKMTARYFQNSDSWNRMKISVSESTTCGKPDFIIILNGSYGIYCGYNMQIEPVVAAVTFHDEYRFERTPMEYWTETNGCPDRCRYTWFRHDQILKFTDKRTCGDDRSWLKRCKDAMPQFIQEFGEFLKHRAEVVK